MNKEKENSPWVLLDIAGTVYAISCSSVLSLNQLSKVTPLPSSPPEARGVIDFRGRLIQLIDTRTLLNLNTISYEVRAFEEMMDKRREDHLNWLNTLEKCVKEDIEFNLTTNPHQCAFGKWYDSYNKKTQNILFLSVFASFDKPHKAIHQIGIKAKELISNGNKDDAIALIESTKDTELKQMLHLFDEIKIAFKESKREIVVVLGEDEKHCISIAVDDIVAIEHLTEIDEDLIRSTMTDTEYLVGIGKRKDGSSVILLNDDYLFSMASTYPDSTKLINDKNE